MKALRYFLASLLLVSVAGLVGCGDDDSSDDAVVDLPDAAGGADAADEATCFATAAGYGAGSVGTMAAPLVFQAIQAGGPYRAAVVLNGDTRPDIALVLVTATAADGTVNITGGASDKVIVLLGADYLAAGAGYNMPRQFYLATGGTATITGLMQADADEFAVNLQGITLQEVDDNDMIVPDGCTTSFDLNVGFGKLNTTPPAAPAPKHGRAKFDVVSPAVLNK